MAAGERTAAPRVHRGVYLVGHPIPARRARSSWPRCSRAATDAFVSHRSAAALWGLTRTAGDTVEVTVVRRGCRSRDGLRVHRVEQLDAADRAHRSGIPVTSPARTLVDYAATANAAELEWAIAEAYAHNLADRAADSSPRSSARPATPAWHSSARSWASRAARTHPVRWRAGDAPADPRRRPAGAAHERPDRRLHRGLLLARGAPDRRGRRLRLTTAIVPRSNATTAGTSSTGRRLRRAPLHRSPAATRSRSRHRGAIARALERRRTRR